MRLRGRHPPARGQEYPSVVGHHRLVRHGVIQAAQTAVIGMSRPVRLRELLLIPDQENVAGDATQEQEIAQRHLTRFVDHQQVKGCLVIDLLHESEDRATENSGYRRDFFVLQSLGP